LKNYHRIKKDYFLEGLKTYVQKFMVKCMVYQQSKGEKFKSLGLLQPLAMPSQCWEDVSLDFTTAIPKSKGNNSIMVVMDQITKYGIVLLTCELK
jgi:hypothetical protein